MNYIDEDKIAYINCLHTYAKEAGMSFWGYCLMDNQMHLIKYGVPRFFWVKNMDFGENAQGKENYDESYEKRNL